MKYKNLAGSTTNCITQPVTKPEFRITANVTRDLQTCQPWGFRIQGGVPPYTITLAAPNSPVVTNVTIPFGDDAFTFINRADPGGQLVGMSLFQYLIVGRLIPYHLQEQLVICKNIISWAVYVHLS
jgi:hypothetical protein